MTANGCRLTHPQLHWAVTLNPLPDRFNMDLRLHQLRALVGVAEQGGIRAAARHLHISQAALTKSLRQLEDAAGVTLLLRSARGISLTDPGKRLLARANLVTQQIELASEELRQTEGGQQGRVRVALTPYLILQHLGPLYREFRQHYPQVALELVEGLATRVLPRLRDSTLDMAAVADIGDLPHGEFNATPMFTMPQRFVVRQRHPVLRDPTPVALAQLEWILTGPQDSLKSERMKAIFSRAGVAPPERIAYCETLAAMTMLRTTDAASIVPASLLDLPEGRGMAAIEPLGLDPGQINFVLLTRPDVPLTPAAAYFARCLLQRCIVA